MAVAEADLVVGATVAQAFANLVVDPPVPTGGARAEADLVVSPATVQGARAFANLVVNPAVVVGARASADLIVKGRTTTPFYRWNATTQQLEAADLWRFQGGALKVASLFRFVNGQLVPQAAPGTQTLPATTATATIENGRSTLTWLGVSGATGYLVSRNGTGSNGQGPIESTEVATARTKLFDNLSNGVAYTLSVQPLPNGPVTSVTVTPTTTAVTGTVKPLMGVGGGPEATFFTPLNVNTNPDRQIGPMLVRRSYGTPVPSSYSNSEMASDFAAGRVSCWSFKPNPQQFIDSPTQQAAFSNFLDTIPAAHKVRIMAHHEPEDNMSSLGGVQVYGELQNVCADLVHQKNRPNLTFGPCWMGTDTWSTTNTNGYDTWLTGPVGQRWVDVIDFDKMDFLGIDPYKTQDNTRSFETMCTVNNNGTGTGGSAPSMMAWLAQFDIPISIMEWGWFRRQPDGHTNAEPPVNPFPDATVAPWITAAYDWFKRWNAAHPPRVVSGKVRGSTIDLACWFNYTLMGSDNPINGFLVSPGPWNQPLKLDAYRKAIADSKIASGGTGTGSVPAAAFTASPLTGEAPLAVQFTNQSTGSPTSYLWQFGDGTTSTAVSPLKTFTTEGLRTVTLTARNTFGVSIATKVDYIAAI